MNDGVYARLTHQCVLSRQCPVCSKRFVPTNRYAQFCGPACKKKDWNRRNPDRVKAHGKTHQAKLSAAKEPRALVLCACRECGAQFHAERKRVLCSRSCELLVKRKDATRLGIDRHKARAKVVTCEGCGLKFCPLYGSKKSTRCDFCPPKKSDCGKSHAARAKHYGVARKHFNPLRIFERDRWTCQLCGVKTPRKLKGTYDDRAPELDHIVPLSAGGAHIQENVQCACRKCNGNKGARPAGQMLLMGFADYSFHYVEGGINSLQI